MKKTLIIFMTLFCALRPWRAQAAYTCSVVYTSCNLKWYLSSGTCAVVAPGYFCNNVQGTKCGDGTCGINACYVPCLGGSYCTGANIAPCSAGYYCPARNAFTTGTPSANLCDKGYFCPEGSADATGKPAADATGCNAGATCPCSAGYFCPDGSTDSQGRPVANATGCNAGAVCNCPAGKYCSGSAGSSDGNGPCNAGYYCLQGSTTATAAPCPIGTYNSSTGGTGPSSCTSCTAGKYCSTTRLTAPDGDCAPGYFCPTGSTSSQGRPVANATGCNAGAVCNCPAGKYCSGSAGSSDGNGPCNAGYYCPQGSTTATANSCPAGTSKSGTGGTYGTEADCTVCAKDKISTADAQLACVACTGAFITTAGTDKTDHDSWNDCTLTCPAGKRMAGANGQTSWTGLNSTTAQCADSAAGQYKSKISAFKLTSPTAAVLTSTDTTANDQAACAPGYFCPAGSTDSQGKPVANATGCNAGVACTCPAGKYCSGTTPSSAGDGNGCAAGYFCPETSTTEHGVPAVPYTGSCTLSGNAKPTCGTGNIEECKCGVGYYSGGDKGCCSNCGAGSYCPGETNTTPTSCPTGYSCAGANQTCPTTCDPGQYGTSMQSCKDCEAGYYCTKSDQADTTLPGNCSATAYVTTKTPCPAGSYQPGQKQTVCTDCDVGKYCVGTTIQVPAIAPTGTCKAGYYCPNCSTDATGKPDDRKMFVPHANSSGGTVQESDTHCGEAGKCVNGNVCSCPARVYCPSCSTSSTGRPIDKTTNAACQRTSDYPTNNTDNTIITTCNNTSDCACPYGSTTDIITVPVMNDRISKCYFQSHNDIDNGPPKTATASKTLESQGRPVNLMYLLGLVDPLPASGATSAVGRVYYNPGNQYW